MGEPITIGLTYTGTEEKHNNYVNWLKGNDNVNIVQLSAEDDNLQLVNIVDGIVLSGGLDMHPRYYNNDVITYPNAPECFNEKRDEFEKQVFETAQQNRIPVLGVCRGMQLVNCLLGGTLTQDIGETANTLHRFEETDKIHGIKILPSTLLHSITATETAFTNSAHHQCVDKPGHGLTINAYSEDGIVEGIEWTNKKDKPFFLGVQWHPERMFKSGLDGTAATKPIRDKFIAEALLHQQRIQQL